VNDKVPNQTQRRAIMVILVLRLAVSAVFAIGGIALLLHKNWLGAFALVLALAFLLLTLRWVRLATEPRTPRDA
jgi:hypothetical protein